MKTTNIKEVTVTINNISVSVPEGATILHAASEAGIKIPTLCHHEELSPSGACRVCIVEISNPSRNPDQSWIDSACVYPVTDGLDIKTNSEKVVRERRLIFQLLLSRAPDSPRIAELAAEYGVKGGEFSSSDGGKSQCILCGLCVRVCNELIKADAIGMANRGIEKEVTSPFLIAESLCIGCMACVQVCPTGVIEFVIKDNKLVKEGWGVALDMMLCPDCGQPVGTVTQMKRLKGETTVTDKRLTRCTACRRKLANSANALVHQ